MLTDEEPDAGAGSTTVRVPVKVPPETQAPLIGTPKVAVVVLPVVVGLGLQDKLGLADTAPSTLGRNVVLAITISAEMTVNFFTCALFKRLPNLG
jgi:hypothetical protein